MHSIAGRTVRRFLGQSFPLTQAVLPTGYNPLIDVCPPVALRQGRGKNTTLLASITHEGVVPCLAAVESTTKQVFEAYVEHLGGGAGFNVMCLYPEVSLGVVMMGNTTSYDHESILDAIVKVPWA